MNSAYIAGFEVGQEKEMAESLVNFWETIDQDKMYKKRTFGWAEGIFEKSMYDNSPMLETMKEVLGERPIKRKLTVGAVNANDGTFHIFNEFDDNLA